MASDKGKGKEKQASFKLQVKKSQKTAQLAIDYVQKAKGESQRQKSSNAGQTKDDKKAVFKPVASNSLQIDWPVIPLNVENSILAVIVELLAPIRPYHEDRDARSRRSKNQKRAEKMRISAKEKKRQKIASEPQLDGANPASQTEEGSGRKRKRSDDDSSSDDGVQNHSKDTPPVKRTKVDHDAEPLEEESKIRTEETQAIPRPGLLDHVIFGLNAVTKRLEAQSQVWRGVTASAPPKAAVAFEAAQTAASQQIPPAPLRLIVICRTDIDSPIMIAHFPTLIAACNSARPANASDVLLVAMPRGAEETLASTSGLRRTSVIAFDVNTPGLERLDPFCISIPILKASWLSVFNAPSEPPVIAYVPTHIKHLHTTAPKDMKAAKKKRADERAAARAKKTAQGKPVKRLPDVLIPGKKVIGPAASEPAEDP